MYNKLLETLIQFECFEIRKKEKGKFEIVADYNVGYGQTLREAVGDLQSKLVFKSQVQQNIINALKVVLADE